MARIDRLMRSGVVVVPVLLLGGLVFWLEREDFQWNLPEEARQQQLYQQQIEHNLRGACIRIKCKRLVLVELLAERITLLEAAAFFRALDRRPPAFYWEEFRRGQAGNTDEERHCHEVIGWVCSEMDTIDPCVSLAITARLEQQLRDHLQRGPLHLTDVQLPEAWLDDADLDD